MRNFHLAVGIISSATVVAQLDTTTIELDVLRAPVSPASVLLGVAESEIQRPTDATSFMVTLRQATNDFGQLPQNYAVDIAPAWLSRKYLSAGDLIGIDSQGQRKQKTFAETMWQTLILSSAFKNSGSLDQDEANPQGAFGLKVSLIQPAATDSTVSKLKKLRTAIRTFNREQINLDRVVISEDSVFRQLQRALAQTIAQGNKIDSILSTVLSMDQRRYWEAQKEAISTLKKAYAEQVAARAATIVKQRETAAQDVELMKAAAEELKVERSGWSWDLAGAFVLNFRDSRLDNSHLTSAAVWTTFGREVDKDILFHFMGRYLFSPSEPLLHVEDSISTADLQFVDAGMKLTFEPEESRFSLTAEAIYRQLLNNDEVEPMWRLVANAQYAVSKNDLLTFSFGKNFDGTITKDGNLVAALNLLIGLGGKRNLVY